MRSRYDIAAFSQDDELVLVGEVKAIKDADESAAVFFRRNLLSHGMLPDAPYFLLAYKTAIYLWKPHAPADAPPNYRAAAKPMLKQFFGDAVDPSTEIGPESLELAIKVWLSNSTRSQSKLEPKNDADRMLIDSGLSEKLMGGEVRREVSL